MMSQEKFSNGDRVRHSGRPEWGIGTITKVESLPMNGHASQRVSIRFPNAGVKTLVTGQGHVLLQRADEAHDPLGDGQPQSVTAWDKMKDSGWLAPMAKRKVEEAMITLPMEVRDPFNSLQMRLTLTMGLYRFDRSGRGVIDWAVAQTGLDDPLTRFTRHELEQKFDRWSFERDQHLAKLIHEIRNSGESAIIQMAMKSAPPAAQDVVRRLTNGR